MKLNRVWIAVVLIFCAATFYELRLKPKSRPLYESALDHYNQGNYSASLRDIDLAYKIEPNSTAILVLMGWDLLKLGRFAEAQSSFSRASYLDPDLVESKLGLGYVAVETGSGEDATEKMRALLREDPKNPDFRLAAASLFRQAGNNSEAAALFLGLLNEGRIGTVARKNLEEMYGMEKLNEKIPTGIPPLKPSSELRVDFRAGDRYLQRRRGNAWENFYVKGIDIGPGTPGHFASEAPVLVEDYLAWLEEISSLGVNTIRVYTALPPAFYRALQRHNQTPNVQPLFLIQEIRLGSSEDSDLFAPAVEEAARQEINRAIDVIHGQGDLPMRKGGASGLYVVDVSEFVLGLLMSRDLPAQRVQDNNRVNVQRDSYSGKYVSVQKGNATEVWLAGMLDYAATYEMSKYNQQRPLAIVNSPALDPLSHPTEASLNEEFTFRRNLGENLTPPAPSELAEDNDVVSVDETRFQASPGLEAGLFASYSVFPFYPDFLYREPKYLAVGDPQGPNPFFGYLKALKSYYRSMPLLLSDYGLSTGMGIARFHPYGWNHGGLTEREQGTALARMTRNIADAAWAGGLVYEWQDEFYKASWLTGPLAYPATRRPLWTNKLDPDQSFGLWTFDPGSDAQLFSNTSGWKSVTPQYAKDKGPAAPLRDGWDTERTLRSLSVSSDNAFVYVRLEVGKVRKDARNLPDLKQAQYFIGISTHPGRFGSRTLPGMSPQVRTEGGSNFLLHLDSTGSARLLIASAYNPREFQPIPGLTSTARLAYRIPFEPKLEEWSGFEEIFVETNRRRFGRDGRMFPPQRYSLSQLRYRAIDQTADTLATWTCDFSGNAFIFRIPWALLFITDPSSRQALVSTEGGPQFVSAETAGLQLSAVSFRPGDPIRFDDFPVGGVAATDSLPALDGSGTFQNMKNYSWPKWDTFSANGRWKAGVDLLQKAFQEVNGAPK